MVLKRHPAASSFCMGQMTFWRLLCQKLMWCVYSTSFGENAVIALHLNHSAHLGSPHCTLSSTCIDPLFALQDGSAGLSDNDRSSLAGACSTSSDTSSSSTAAAAEGGQQRQVQLTLLQSVHAPGRVWLQSFFAELQPDRRQVSYIPAVVACPAGVVLTQLWPETLNYKAGHHVCHSHSQWLASACFSLQPPALLCTGI